MFGHTHDDSCRWVTCDDCGLLYCDWEDWSGPAHDDNDCVRELKKRILKMTLDEYQSAVERTMARPAEVSGLRDDNMLFALGVAGEGGEVADMIKKWAGHGHTLDLGKLEKELGDVLWYVTALAKANGLTLEHVARANVEKLKKRYPGGFSFEASINRKE